MCAGMEVLVETDPPLRQQRLHCSHKVTGSNPLWGPAINSLRFGRSGELNKADGMYSYHRNKMVSNRSSELLKAN
jgi:hypothetical protein